MENQKALESYFEEHAQEVWERIWINPEMQTTLLNTYPPKLIEEIAGPLPEMPLDYEQILKGGGKFWHDVNCGYLPEDLVLAARREEIDWAHSEGVHEIVPGPALGGHRQVCGSDTQENSIEVVCKRIQNEEAR